ncbi:MAG: molybdopterin-binding protein [Gemmatimonadetes bacterium]|nr:molybdopterin-binding protein [Gemmatimonadota bacterium]
MKFGPIPLDQAEGRILAHNVTSPDGRRILRKGHPVDGAALRILRDLGLSEVYVAELDPDDVPEDAAAARVARILAGPGVEAGSPHTGRVNLTAEQTGVVLVESETLDRLNGIEGFTVATLRTHTLVWKGDRVATVKVIPYALPWEAVARAEALANEHPIVSVRALTPRRVGIVLVGNRGAWDGLREGLGQAILGRVEKLGCPAGEPAFSLPHERSVADELLRQVDGGAGLVVIAGETAIMDLGDVIPRGVRTAGGRVEHLGLAMDPGHLLLLAYLRDVPVLGAPGCVRGSTPDGFDAIFPRLLTGELLTRSDLQALGHGGLLSNPRVR